MKTLNRLSCFGASVLLLAAGMTTGADPAGPDPIGPVDYNRPSNTASWFRGTAPASDLSAFKGSVPGAAVDKFVRDSAPVGEAGNPPTTAPATQPATSSVDALIAQLGAEKFAKREEAAEALKKLGKDALPALQKAATSTDPQIRTSAQGLVGEITGATAAKPPATSDEFNARLRRVPRQLQVGNLPGGGLRVTSRVQLNMVVNGQITRDVTVEENGRKVHIHEDTDGILVEVTENGQTKESKAKTAAELKTADPAASKLYENYSGQGAGVIRIEPARP